MNTLLIFIKNPMLGKAKTRLAATVGEERALAIYKELLRHTREIATQTEAKRLLFYSHFIDEKDEWSAGDFQKYLQIDGDLGEKMGEGFQIAFGQKASKVIIMGSDCASLTPEIASQAFEVLDNHDFVIGPADDGGYYLIGMKTFSPTIFENIDWSTELVFSQTVKAIQQLNRTYGTLPTLSDIDYEEDWIKHGWDF
jgi:rSAM/selenodomain-associated transferase 1